MKMEKRAYLQSIKITITLKIGIIGTSAPPYFVAVNCLLLLVADRSLMWCDVVRKSSRISC
jgi:hypothetical protein